VSVAKQAFKGGLEMATEKHDVLRPFATAVFIATLALGASACGAQDQPVKPKVKPAAEAPGGTGVTGTTSAERSLQRDRDPAIGEPVLDKEKEKRGNTPPGTTRAGEPPAAGAIVDPAGVTK
jgi:hypothetical protein